MTDRSTAEPVSVDATFEKAVDLVVAQDSVVQSWFTSLVAVQSGLGVAAAAILTWKGSPATWPLLAAVLLIAVLAITLYVSMNAILKRHMEWQAAYIKRVRALQAPGREIYIDNMVAAEPRITNVLARMERLVVAAWLLVGLALLIAKLCDLI